MSRCGERSTDRVANPVSEQAVSRYLGLSLGGAKSDRTCVAVVDYYRKQDKAFVVDIFSEIGPEDELTADQVLTELVLELSGKRQVETGTDHAVRFGTHQPEVRIMGVDAPLTLPPCLPNCETSCQGYDKCKRPAVKWMRQQYARAKKDNPKIKHFTPYSQRPVDLYFRYKHMDQDLFQDETMGANLAPQAVRMGYLKRHLEQVELVEVWPKLALFNLQKYLKLTRREVLSYRHLEHGLHIRTKILERLVERSHIFIYERDLKKFLTNMGAFDALLCAWVAMLSDLGRVVKFKSDLPLESGWVQIPEL